MAGNILTHIDYLDESIARLSEEIEGVIAPFSEEVALLSTIPGNEESAGKRRSGKTRKGSKWLRSALTEAAHAAARTKGSYLSAHYARIRGRRGSKKAAVAVGHSILVIAYHLLGRKVPYEDLGEDYYARDQRCSSEAHAKRLVRQLERL